MKIKLLVLALGCLSLLSVPMLGRAGELETLTRVEAEAFSAGKQKTLPTRECEGAFNCTVCNYSYRCEFFISYQYCIWTNVPTTCNDSNPFDCGQTYYYELPWCDGEISSTGGTCWGNDC